MQEIAQNQKNGQTLPSENTGDDEELTAESILEHLNNGASLADGLRMSSARLSTPWGITNIPKENIAMH